MSKSLSQLLWILLSYCKEHREPVDLWCASAHLLTVWFSLLTILKQKIIHVCLLTVSLPTPLCSPDPLKQLNRIQWNLTGNKISMSSTKFVFFRPIGKTRWPPLPLIGWDIFDFSSETTEQNSINLDRKQDLNVLYQVYVFQVEWKNKMAALTSDWLRHFSTFPLKLLNRIERKLVRKQDLNILYQVCVFPGWSEKQDGHPGLWLAETFLTSLKPLNGIQQNLTGSKIITSPTKFVFFGPIGKTRWPPWPLIGWNNFNSSSETAKRNSTKLDRKQDLIVLYQFCVFWADW